MDLFFGGNQGGAKVSRVRISHLTLRGRAFTWASLALLQLFRGPEKEVMEAQGRRKAIKGALKSKKDFRGEVVEVVVG